MLCWVLELSLFLFFLVVQVLVKCIVRNSCLLAYYLPSIILCCCFGFFVLLCFCFCFFPQNNYLRILSFPLNLALGGFIFKKYKLHSSQWFWWSVIMQSIRHSWGRRTFQEILMHPATCKMKLKDAWDSAYSLAASLRYLRVCLINPCIKYNVWWS